MKKIFIMMFVLTVSLVTVGCSHEVSEETETQEVKAEVAEQNPSEESPKPIEGYKTYENISGFSLQYPSDWGYQEDVYGSLVMFYAPEEEGDIFRENLGILTEDLPSKMNVNEYYDQSKVYLEKFITDFEQISLEDFKVDGIDAKKITYKGSQGEYVLQRQQVFFVKEKTAYVLTYTALEDSFSSVIDTVNTIISTFNFN